MTLATLAPPFASPAHLGQALAQQGHALVSPQAVCELAGCLASDLGDLARSWDGLPSDNYLKDGGKYRRRRHSCFIVQGDHVEPAPHRAHWQPLEYNALHGGMLRCRPIGTVFANCLPIDGDGLKAPQLRRRQAENAFGAGVERADGAGGVVDHDAFAHAVDDGAETGLRFPQARLGAKAVGHVVHDEVTRDAPIEHDGTRRNLDLARLLAGDTVCMHHRAGPFGRPVDTPRVEGHLLDVADEHGPHAFTGPAIERLGRRIDVQQRAGLHIHDQLDGCA